MSSPLNGFGHQQNREEDSKEELHLELSLSTSPSCCTPTTSSISSSISTSSVSAPSPSRSPPPPPPPFMSSPPYYYHFTAAAIPPPPPPQLYTAYTTTMLRSSDHQPSRDMPRPTSRTRRSPVQTFKPGKTKVITPPYPWSTNKRAIIYSMDFLLTNKMDMISGEVQCKRCEKVYRMEYNLREKFMEIASFIRENKSGMHDRAPAVWMNPSLPNCKFCGQTNCVRPLIDKKRSINWLFLLLGKFLGCCKLDQLKYFCKHTKNHRTGAKDRVLYLTYLGLCKQLDPTGPFDV